MSTRVHHAQLNTKMERILACPSCRNRIESPGGDALRCNICGLSYDARIGVPLLVRADSPVRAWFGPQGHSKSSRLLDIAMRFTPPDRVWTRASQRVIERIVADADDADVTSVLIGAGNEKVYRRILAPYRSVIRVGLPHRGDVNVAADVCVLPFLDNSVDLIFSSSVLEHVYNPEAAVAEMYRCLKPGGRVYAEIPFQRLWHGQPVDYQRYTYSGIEKLFERHGFTIEEKGICSGPFTTLALFVRDFTAAMVPWRYPRGALTLSLQWALHPLKWLDRLCENAKWARIAACNFYYLGRKA